MSSTELSVVVALCFKIGNLVGRYVHMWMEIFLPCSNVNNKYLLNTYYKKDSVLRTFEYVLERSSQ